MLTIDPNALGTLVMELAKIETARQAATEAAGALEAAENVVENWSG